MWITSLSDRLLIGILKDFSSTGIYSIGYKLGQSMSIFSESIFKVYKPIMFSMFAEDREDAVKKLERFLPSFFFAIYWVAFLIALFSREAIVILTDKNFHEAYKIVPVVVFAYLFQSLYKPFMTVISYYKKTWIFFAGSIIQASSNLILNLIFIPIFDRIAAAWTTFLSYFIMLIWFFIWSQKIEKIKVDWLKILKIIAVSVIPFSFYYLFIHFYTLSFILTIITKIILILISFSLSYFFKLVDLPVKKK